MTCRALPTNGSPSTDLIPPYRPQLARLVDEAPDGPEWLHELKYDGYRIGCRIDDGDVTLLSRNGKDWTAAFPEIRDAARALGVRQALLDGEAAIVLEDGRTSFQALQNALAGGSRRGLVYYAFDLLHAGGETFLQRPLEARKTELLRLVGTPESASVIRYSEHVVGAGRRMFEEACRLKLEGIVSKLRDAPYKTGRTGAWVKTKCTFRQEFIIGGFTDPEGSRQGIGSLLVGFHEADGRLTFAGKVGTGFTTAVSRDLRRRLEALEQDTPPFSPRPPGWLGRHAHWVRPELVAEVAFTEWTTDGRIRHPSFQGLRADRTRSNVVRERAASKTRRRSADAEVSGVRISHPDRVLYPEIGFTKLDLARAYEGIADWILPHLEGRPLTLVRCPTGIGGECFFMKHSKVWGPAAIRRVKIQEKTKVGEYLVADTLAALVALVQMDVLEVHTWNSRVGNVEHPDRIVIDLDPGGQVSFETVAKAGRLVRAVLDELSLESFAKTTGGRGLHVVVPLVPRAGWQECLEFARHLAQLLVRHDPDLFTIDFAKRGRERKILIDYLRNNRTNTSIAAYSTRARPHAPISVPVRWQELTPSLDPASWTIRSIQSRLSRLRKDPWDGYWTSRQRLTASMTRALAQL